MTIDYEGLVQEAMRGVVRRILQDVSKTGLEDPNHFYVTFKTDYPGVSLPGFVKDENPEEVTIVLQHQFWDLQVGHDSFSVMLSFQDTPHQVRVPFDALMSFVDPSFRFGLHFTPPVPGEEIESPGAPEEVSKKGTVLSLDAFRRK
jgi:hypothetical protein